MLFHRTQCHIHMFCDLRIGPSPVRQHGNGKFRSRQIIGDILFRLRIMDSPPAITELIRDLNHFLVSFRIIGLQTGFNQPLQQTMMFSDTINPSGFAILQASIKYAFAASD